MYNSTIQELKKRKNRYIIIPMKKGSWLKPAESRMHLLDPEPDLGNANVGRYDMHIFCRYTSTYICFFNLYEHIINRFFQYHKGICFCKNTHTGGTKNYVRHLS